MKSEGSKKIGSGKLADWINGYYGENEIEKDCLGIEDVPVVLDVQKGEDTPAGYQGKIQLRGIATPEELLLCTKAWRKENWDLAELKWNSTEATCFKIWNILRDSALIMNEHMPLLFKKEVRSQ